MLEKLKTYAIELKNRNYAHNTIKAYKRHISNFLEYADENPAMQPEDRIPLFLDSCYKSHEEKRIAYSAIRAFYEYVIKKNCPYTLNKIRRRRRLPGILNREEVIAILSQIKNRKHFLMIALMYASGLRVSEVVKLKVKDIDLQALSIHVRNSKHHTDRYTIFSSKLQEDLAALVKDRRPEEYLFLTIYNKKYAIRTVQEILEKSYLKTGLNKKATCHTLRHSFATHLKESGVDLKSIQSLLGHKSIKTTTVYIHLANPVCKEIKSPLSYRYIWTIPAKTISANLCVSAPSALNRPCLKSIPLFMLNQEIFSPCLAINP